MNLQRKPPDSLGDILDAIDSHTGWDAICFQEVLRFEGIGNDKILVMKEIGKLSHTVFISGYARGSYSTAIAVHRRWARSVTHMAQSFRLISINILSRGSTNQHQNIQINSSQIPSLVGRDAEQVVPAVQAWGDALRGSRRHAIFTGMDANMEFRQPLSGSVGGALRHHPHQQERQRGGPPEEVRAAMYAELEGNKQAALNTFQEWYNVMERDAEDDPHSATTWKGKIFGADHEGTLDYIIMDKHTATILQSSWRLSSATTGVPTDHTAIFARFIFKNDPSQHYLSQGKKPIGWRPYDSEAYKQATEEHFPEGRIMTMQDIAARLAALADSMGSSRRHPPRPAGTSSTDERLRAIIRCASSSPAERQAAVEELWRCRTRIESEKLFDSSAHVMKHLRLGGWGAQHLTARHACMPYSDDSGEKILDVGSIQERAQQYYAGLFESPPQEHLEADAMVAQALEEGQVANMTTQSSVIVDTVRRARLALRDGKTCGADMLVAEVLKGTGHADWQWAVAFNTRIMNSEDVDPCGIIADPIWDRFDVSLLPKANAPTAFKMLRPIAILLASAKLWSRCFFTILGEYDTGCSASHLGLRLGHSCSELVTTVRLLLERRGEWRLRTCLVQIEFARAYDSIVHAAILDAMSRRNVPLPLALAYIREAGRAHLAFRHAEWETSPIRAGVGL